MSTAEGPKSVGLIARVQGILFRPKVEWDVIDDEPATIQGVFIGYACVLAAIPAICSLIGEQAFGAGSFHIHPPLMTSVLEAAANYVLGLVGTFVLALLINALAPSFGGYKDQLQAIKVAVYSSTAGWIAGVFHLVPILGIVTFIGTLYGLYLLYTGLPRLMKSPPEKSLGFTLVTIVCAAVIDLLVAAVIGLVVGPILFSGH